MSKNLIEIPKKCSLCHFLDDDKNYCWFYLIHVSWTKNDKPDICKNLEKVVGCYKTKFDDPNQQKLFDNT